ncbi:MAG TPA: LUD domain-containing protein [Patescibacteria group bacterium]|nr:LUD domain-containing protein [Patescibacteria group bacterium]
MYDTIPADDVINRTVAALTGNGMEAMVVANGVEAKEQLLKLLPKGSEVMNMTSVTLDTISSSDAILNSGVYNPARKKLMDPNSSPKEKMAAGAVAEWTTGSVHAVTEDGRLMIASNTGSQLGAEAYGSEHVIFVVGAQKIVKDVDEGFKRIYEYVLPKESVRANKAYNITTGSFVSKLLMINREVRPGRIKVILVKEKLGF